MQTGRRVPLTIERGDGLRVQDDAGNTYLDFVGGWAVDTLGHCHPVIVQALEQQGRRLIQTSNQYYTIPQLELAQLLVDNSCMSRVYVCNSGAEANEGAIKLARKYGRLNREGAYEVITALNSFHGRTLAMVSATGQPAHQDIYQPIPEGFVNVPFNDVEAVKAVTTKKTCAVMLEAIQGEAGVIAPKDGYLKDIRNWCDENGLLLILDEVQTGIGRLGTLFAYQQYDIEPDIMTLAKGLGGGVPIGAFMATQKAAVFSPGDHGSTYGGNPLTCAVATAVVSEVLNGHLLENTRRAGQRLTAGLEKLRRLYPFVTEVRGRGLLQAIEFSEPIAPSVLTACLENRLLVNAPRPTSIRFMPPLVVTDAEIDEALEKLSAALHQITETKNP